MLENVFQRELIKDIEHILPGAIVIKNDPTYLQGFPDLLILYYNKWAALECKKSAKARYQPNQEYYLRLLDDMSYANTIWPENKEEVLDELQQALQY